MRQATTAEMGLKGEEPKRSIVPALLMRRLSQISRSGGTNRETANRLSYKVRESLFVQEPLLGRGILKQTGDIIRDGFSIVKPGSKDEHRHNDVFQAWWRDQFLDSTTRENLIAAHLHGDGPVEIEWSDDAADGRQPVRESAVPVAVHLVDPVSVRLERLKGKDGKQETFLVQDQFGDDPVTLHPDRYHVQRFLRLPGQDRSISTVERAYNAALSKVKGDQAIGEILYFAGVGKLHAKVKDAQEGELDAITEMINDPNFVRGFVWNDRLELTDLGVSVIDPGPFDAVLKSSIAAAIGIPVMMLEGAQAGAVTGSETNLEDYRSDLKICKRLVPEPLITRLFTGLTGQPSAKFDVQWHDAPPLKPKIGEQAMAFQTYIDAGLTAQAAARIVGLVLQDDDLEEEEEVLPPVGEQPPDSGKSQPGDPGNEPGPRAQR